MSGTKFIEEVTSNLKEHNIIYTSLNDLEVDSHNFGNVCYKIVVTGIRISFILDRGESFILVEGSDPITNAKAAKITQDLLPAETVADWVQIIAKHLCEKVIATKHDTDKPMLSLINRTAMESEAEVLMFGLKKYGRNNWKLGMQHSRILDAVLRHIFKYLDGEKLDDESGLNHLAHARAGLGFILHYIENKLGQDDIHSEE